MEKEVVEQYLKTILSLCEDKESAKTTDIARRMDLAPASVTESLQKLSEEELVEYQPYHGCTLTEKGKHIAMRVSRKHRLLERFLTDVLGLEPSKVHEQACEMEHSLSDEAEVALCRVLNHPDKCSDDDKEIPPCNLDVADCLECKAKAVEALEPSRAKGELRPLTSLTKGERATVQFIRAGRGAVSRLHSMGFTKGADIELMNTAPFSGPIEICIRGCKVVIGRGIASKVFVR